MASTSAGTTPVEDLSSIGLAERVRGTQRARARAEAELLELAVAWAHGHPELDEGGQPVPVERVDDDALAAHFAGLEPEEPLDSPAWAGLPPVAWDAPAAFGTACETGTTAAAGLIRDALVLCHRLPRLWRRLQAGELPAWRGRMIAREVAGAPDDVVAAIDAALAPVCERAGIMTLRRLIREAMVRLYAEYVELASLEYLDARHVRFHRDQVNHTGIAPMDIRGDYADLDDFDQTLTELAHRLVEVDQDAAHQSLQERRARAVGILSDPARAQQLLDHENTSTGTSAGSAASPRRRRRRSARVLELRITDLGLLGLDPVGSFRADGEDIATLAERIAAWCGRETSDLIVLPVVDPTAHATTDGYRPTDPLRDHIDVRDRTCLFPHCTRPARGCDHDHVIAYDDGGATCSCNLVPLCRHHHRLKTHAGYRSMVVEPGLIWWTTPHGHEFLTDRHGTRSLQRGPPHRTGCLHDAQVAC